MLSFILVYCFPLQLVGIRKATRYIKDAAPVQQKKLHYGVCSFDLN